MVGSGFYGAKVLYLGLCEHVRCTLVVCGNLIMRELVNLLAYLLYIILGSMAQPGGYAEGKCHACYGRMYAALEHEPPHEQTYAEVANLAMYLAIRQIHARQYASEHSAKMRQGDVVGVIYGNDKNASEVICHSQCGKKYFQSCRHTFGEHGQHTQRECNVCGHGDGHASLHDVHVFGVACQVTCNAKYYGGHNHATYCRKNRK